MVLNWACFRALCGTRSRVAPEEPYGLLCLMCCGWRGALAWEAILPHVLHVTIRSSPGVEVGESKIDHSPARPVRAAPVIVVSERLSRAKGFVWWAFCVSADLIPRGSSHTGAGKHWCVWIVAEASPLH